MMPPTRNALQPHYSFNRVIVTAAVPTTEQEQETDPGLK